VNIVVERESTGRKRTGVCVEVYPNTGTENVTEAMFDIGNGYLPYLSDALKL
jgi:hypothetical protein